MDDELIMQDADRRRSQQDGSTIRLRTIQDGNRHAPDPLTTETPVPPVGNHPVNPVPATFRQPLYRILRLQRFFAELININKPLFRGSVDDRVAAPPAM